MWASRGPTAPTASRTPPTDPGAFRTKAREPRCSTIPASPRESAALGTRGLSRRRFSIPGILREMRGAVASGVRSRLVMPVPPAVTITRAPFSTAARIAPWTLSMPSGTTAGPVTDPNLPSRSAARGPDRSSRAPCAQRSETVMTAMVSGMDASLARSVGSPRAAFGRRAGRRPRGSQCAPERRTPVGRRRRMAPARQFLPVTSRPSPGAGRCRGGSLCRPGTVLPGPGDRPAVRRAVRQSSSPGRGPPSSRRCEARP